MGTNVAVQRYSIDKRSSRFIVKATAAGMLSAFGHNPSLNIRDLSGEVGFDPAAPAESSLRLKIQASSIEVAGDISSKDRREMDRLMNEEVLEIAKYPEVVYESTAVSFSVLGEGRFRADISGNLTLHGVTQPQPVSALVTVMGDTLRASGEFSVEQTRFSIKLVSVAGGGLKLKDELKFTFDIVARKQQE